MENQLTLEQLKSVVSNYIASNKIAITSFSATTNNIVGMLDKIGKIISLDTNFYDKLPELDGDDLQNGKTIEEYYQDLILAIDYNQDEDGSRALKFYSPTFRPVSYSYSCGKKILPESIPNNNIERAVNNTAEFVDIISRMTKRLSDSRDAFKYQCKREILGKLADKMASAYSGASTYTNASTDIVEGTFYKQSTNYAVCVKAKTHATGDTWANLVSGGYLIPLKFKVVKALPVDEATGEAFIKAVKECVEDAQDISEGYSLNGNTIGAELGLKLYIKHGIMPSIQVDTLAGAFHKDELSTGVETKVIKDFGSTTSNVYAMLIDPRGVKLHKDYEAVREQHNGFGDFLTLLHHMEFTAFVSRNTFITMFVTA